MITINIFIIQIIKLMMLLHLLDIVNRFLQNWYIVSIVYVAIVSIAGLKLIYSI